MRLSSDYSRVALFEYKAGDVEYDDTGEDIESEFQAGPFVYKVYFTNQGPREPIGVQFELVDIEASDAELVQMFYDLAKRTLPPEKVRELSPREAKEQARHVIDKRSQLSVGLMEPYSKQILGKTLNIIREYVSRYHPHCIEFTAVGQKRANIYHGMVKRAFPQAKVDMQMIGTRAVYFNVCQG